MLFEHYLYREVNLLINNPIRPIPHLLLGLRSQLVLYITVTNQNDTISGTPGDAIAGDNSNDTISGGKGNDILTGGKGSDQFIFFSKEGTDIITDFSKGTDFAVLAAFAEMTAP